MYAQVTIINHLLTGSICKRDFKTIVLRISLRTFYFGARKLDLHNGALFVSVAICFR